MQFSVYDPSIKMTKLSSNFPVKLKTHFSCLPMKIGAVSEGGDVTEPF